jgi:amidohydrolase
MILLVHCISTTVIAAPDFAALVEQHAEEAIQARRWLHEHAELSLRETETRAWLVERLSAIEGVELVDGEWETGIVAVLRGAKPGPIIAYRSDMDALPIREETGLPFACTATDTYRGREVGVMHACGHDFHMAILLGTATILSELRSEMAGSILFVLEPAEEIGAGSRLLIEAGLFEQGRKPESIFAIHVHPSIPYGQISYCPGRASGNVDTFRIKVVGRGGHGAYPHKTIDPTAIASRLVLALQSIVGREIDTSTSAVISVGSIHGGTTTNVIPDTVEVTGTVRSLEPEVRQQLSDAIQRTARGLAEAAGAPEPLIDYRFGTPSMYNDPDLIARSLPVFQRVVGEQNVIRYTPKMGGEDFSRYQKRVPGLLFRLGVGREDREMNLHSSTFDPDERAIPLGIRLACELLMHHLEADG